MLKFSAQDAQTLLEVAQAAPLQNYHAAKNLDALFVRYLAFVREHLPPPKPLVTEAVGKTLAEAQPGEKNGKAVVPEVNMESPTAESAG
jgi:hypothetical protein